MDKYNCTLLVNGYDKGDDLWDGFFTLLKINWPTMPFPIVLNTESKSYSFDGFDIKTFSIFKNNIKVAWAKRLKETLRKIDSEYILFMLDDFWIEKPVNEKLVFKALETMMNNKEISNICLYRTQGTYIEDNRFDDFILKDKNSIYKLSTQVGLWRREKLVSYLRNHESAWDWELFANKRTFKLNDKFYCVRDNNNRPIFYDVDRAGAIHRGKWSKEVIERIKKKYGIKVDCSIRGYDDWVIEQKPSTFIEKITKPNFYGRLKQSIILKVHEFLSTI